MAGDKAVHLETVSQINTYINKIHEKAQHHARNVEPIIIPLAKAVLERLDLNHDKVEVSTRLGNVANACWVTISGTEYFFSYNQKTKKIEIREKTTQGKVIWTFDKQTPIVNIHEAIATL